MPGFCNILGSAVLGNILGELVAAAVILGLRVLIDLSLYAMISMVFVFSTVGTAVGAVMHCGSQKRIHDVEAQIASLRGAIDRLTQQRPQGNLDVHQQGSVTAQDSSWNRAHGSSFTGATAHHDVL